MDELLGCAVTAGMTVVTKKVTQKVARKGIVTLKAKGVKVPVWMEHVATSLAGLAVTAGVNETIGVSEMIQASAAGDWSAEPGFVAAGPTPGLEQDRPAHGGTLPTAGP